MKTLGLFGVVICAALGALPAYSEEVPDEALVQTLEQAFVGEADFKAEIDHAAIGHVLVKRAQENNISLLRQTQRYVSIFKINILRRSKSAIGVRILKRATWVRNLTTACDKPAGWPSSIAWSEDNCFAVVERARAFLRGELKDPCHGQATHWGAPDGVDLERATRAKWPVVDCGKTANVFYKVK